MKSSKAKEFESIGSAAARLLAEIERRAKEASGGFKQPEQIQGSGTGPSSGENAPGARKHGEAALRPGAPEGQPGEKVADANGGGPASASAWRGEDALRRWGMANNDNQAGGVKASEAGLCGDAPARADQRRFVNPLFTGLESFSETSTARWGK